MKHFIDLVVQKGVKCLMLVTAITMVNVYPLVGLKVHEYLQSLNIGHAVPRSS